MYGRGFDPAARGEALYTVASILIFAWILAAAGVFDAGAASYVLLAGAAVVVGVGVAAARRRV